ncbi:hypothetical protein [Hydrogenophaga soli]
MQQRGAADSTAQAQRLLGVRVGKLVQGDGNLEEKLPLSLSEQAQGALFFE